MARGGKRVSGHYEGSNILLWLDENIGRLETTLGRPLDHFAMINAVRACLPDTLREQIPDKRRAQRQQVKRLRAARSTSEEH